MRTCINKKCKNYHRDTGITSIQCKLCGQFTHWDNEVIIEKGTFIPKQSCQFWQVATDENNNPVYRVRIDGELFECIKVPTEK